MIGVCGGALLTTQEKAIFQCCRFLVCANHHRPPGLVPDVAVGNFGVRVAEGLAQHPDQPKAFYNAAMKIDGVPLLSGISAVIYAIKYRSDPNEIIFIGGMDFYRRQRASNERLRLVSVHDLNANAAMLQYIIEVERHIEVSATTLDALQELIYGKPVSA